MPVLDMSANLCVYQWYGKELPDYITKLCPVSLHTVRRHRRLASLYFSLVRALSLCCHINVKFLASEVLSSKAPWFNSWAEFEMLNLVRPPRCFTYVRATSKLHLESNQRDSIHLRSSFSTSPCWYFSVAFNDKSLP